jgi:hypothetical protein
MSSHASPGLGLGRRWLWVGRCWLPWAGGLGPTWRPQEAAAEEIEVRPAKHLAFQHLEAVNVPLDWARTPRQGHPGFDCLVVLIQSCGEAAQSLDRAGGGAREPQIELRRLPLAHQGHEILREVDRLGHLGRREQGDPGDYAATGSSST